MNNNLTLAIVAVDKVLTNLAASDFVTDAGTLAMQEIRRYRLDLVGDIFTAFEGRFMTEEEIAEVMELNP